MAAAAVLPASAALSLPAAPPGVPAAPAGVPLPPGLTPGSMEHTLWTWTQYSLQNHLHENAVFLAERLCAEVPTDWAKHLLATCYFQSGAANRAVAVLHATTTPQNRYLLALCHVRLGKLAEAQTVLLGSAAPDTEAVAQVPNSAAGLYLMGVICLKSQQVHIAYSSSTRYTPLLAAAAAAAVVVVERLPLTRTPREQRARAIKYLNRCLAINPFMWSASEALCQLGAALPEALLPAPPASGAPHSAAPLTPAVPPGPSFGWTGAEGGGTVPASANQTPCAATPLATPSGGCTPMRAPQLFTPADSGGGGGGGTIPSSAAASMGMSMSAAPPELVTPA